jgi:photosystem II stability/assembly factor-like uncharacterized protein
VFCVLRVLRLLNQSIRGLGELSLSGPASFLGLLLLGCVPACAQRWERLGPPGGMVITLAAAADGMVYLGTPDGHIFASSDRGEHWALRGRAGGRLDGVVQRIVPDVCDAKRLLAAVWFREVAKGGVFESVDAGKSWRLIGLAEEAVRALEQSASNPKVWVAGTRTGVFRSADNGQTWQRITQADDAELQNVDSLAIDPEDAQTIYVGTYHLPWKTTDGGKMWNSISQGMIDDSDIMSLRIDAANPRRIFSSACSGIYRSEDGGATWTKLQGVPYSSRRTQQIVQDPTDEQTLYAATTGGLWMTSDSGETWKRITAPDTDASAVVVLASQKGKRVLAGMSAQGILRSDDSGNTFAVSNEGFSHRVIAAAAVDRESILIRAEGYGNKLLQSDDGGKTWRDFNGAALSKAVEQIYSTSNGWWVSFGEGGLARFDAARQVWRAMVFREDPPKSRTREPRRRFAGRVVAPRVRSLVMTEGKTFAGTENGLWQLTSGATEFRRAATRMLPASVTYLSSTSTGMPLAIAGGALWQDNGGSEWKQMETPASGGRLLWTVESEVAGQKVSSLGTQHGVFVRDSGRWRLLSNGLPAIGSAVPAFSGTRCLLAMNNGGLYESVDGLNTWRRVESENEQGTTSGIFAMDAKGFVVASRQEGVLSLDGERN